MALETSGRTMIITTSGALEALMIQIMVEETWRLKLVILNTDPLLLQ